LVALAPKARKWAAKVLAFRMHEDMVLKNFKLCYCDDGNDNSRQLTT
jgi:hypothetical protein